MGYKISRYGWLADLPDHRDPVYAAPVGWAAGLPASADLHPQCPPVYNESELGSGTANAITVVIEFNWLKQKLADFTLSRLFIYYNERVIEHRFDTDSGVQIRDGIKSVARPGDCPETEWPYVIAKFRSRPPKQCYADALKYRVVAYQRLSPVLNQLKGRLASGYPFVFGFTLFERFESSQVARAGHASVPVLAECANGANGGHAVVGVGYQDAKQWFVVRNSWGGRWGVKGYFTLPYAYLTDENLASDFWTIRIVQ